MPSKLELRKLARSRLDEAKVLAAAGHYDGAIYLAGYVVELALKARICRILDMNEYPDTGDFGKAFKTHKYDDLLRLAGLQAKFDAAKAANPDLLTNWSLVTNWSEQLRYQPAGTSPATGAQEVIAALEDSSNGILQWIARRW